MFLTVCCSADQMSVDSVSKSEGQDWQEYSVCRWGTYSILIVGHRLRSSDAPPVG